MYGWRGSKCVQTHRAEARKTHTKEKKRITDDGHTLDCYQVSKPSREHRREDVVGENPTWNRIKQG